MPDTPNSRLASTSVPIHPDLAARWSPRAFDPDAAITADQLTALLEAARWAASWGHRQPVRFVVGVRADETFATLAGLLKRGNSYAHAASALILVCADEGEDERTARYAAVDAGAAIAQLTVEAVSRGLIVHPIAGFDVEGAGATFGIPGGVRPLAVIAVGALGDYSEADPAIVERDSRARERLPLEQIVVGGRWGIPLDSPKPD
ncbi:nitroreductase family protein [Mycobacterium sp. DL440]|uniref:nitroreductase family protein n=1 Tax=Mycobacterium sp. DL440 TaxID=2675523 RepID=UPI00142046FF|nr:nitroreductase family protein [Mycobacterium sp. DL440]